MGLGYTPSQIRHVAQGGRRQDVDRQRTNRPPADPWAAWNISAEQSLANRGIYPPTYYGRGEGKYAGLNTLSELQAYGRGKGQMLYDERQGWADEMTDTLVGSAERVDDVYEDRVSAVAADARAKMPTYAETPELAAYISAQMRKGGGGHGWNPDAHVGRGDVIEYPRQMRQTETAYRAEDQAPGGRGLDVALGGSWTTDQFPARASYVHDGYAGTPARPQNVRQVGWNYLTDKPSHWIRHGLPTGSPEEGYERVVQGDTLGSTVPVGETLWDEYAAGTYNAGMRSADEWRQSVDDRMLAEAEAIAADRARSPIAHAYDALVGIGVDPALAAGWFGPDEELAYARTNLGLAGLPMDEAQLARDLWALEQGQSVGDMSITDYDEYEQWAAEQDKLSASANDRDAEEKAQAWADAVFNATQTMDGAELAQATNMTPDQLTAVLFASDGSGRLAPAFEEALAKLEGLRGGGIDSGEYEAYMTDLALSDRALYNVLRTLYGPVIPTFSLDSYSPAG